MGKGIDAYKLILYVFICLLGIFVIIIILSDINTKVHAALNGTFEPEKFPAPQTVESDINIENMRAFAGSDEVTQGKSSALLIRDLGTIPVKIEFDATMPKNADYPKEGTNIIFRFDSEFEKKDFDSCSVVKNVAPGASVHVSSDEIAGCLTVKSDWSGWVTVRISAKTLVNGDEQGLATSYENFRIFRKMKLLGSLCDLIKAVKDYPSQKIYVSNDAKAFELGKINEPAAQTANGITTLTVDGVKCENVILEGADIYGNDYRNFETSPDLKSMDKLAIKIESIFILQEEKRQTTCDAGGSPVPCEQSYTTLVIS